MPLTKVYCDACGHCMTDKKKGTCIALKLNINDHPEADRVKEVFGKTDFNLCWVCCLKASGVKPKET